MNEELVPIPSDEPSTPLPARVLTLPDESINRILFPQVLCINISVESIANPVGLLKVAALPWPSVEPVIPEPAKVDTFPDESILRILLPPNSDT